MKITARQPTAISGKLAAVDLRGLNLRPDRLLAVAGTAALATAVIVRPEEARSAASQVWSPFVLVAGLLLVGLVADQDGLFRAAGGLVARTSPSGLVLFAGSVAMIGTVTAILNLDTSVAFLTPVLVYAARSRGGGQAPLLYGSLLLANAGSLFLPGSNLTNLIVLGHLHLTGAEFLSRMWAPALVALVITALVIAWHERHSLRIRPEETVPAQRASVGLGLLAVVTVTILVVVLRSPALAVGAVGVFAAVLRLTRRKLATSDVAGTLGAPILIGLFGLAVAMGTLGRVWSAPSTWLSHLDLWGTAVVGALASVVCNNLPAASLLAARAPRHPLALLVGLNIGPNLFVTGSLAWLLWLRVARRAGAAPSIGRASRLGMVAVPLAMAASLAVLSFVGSG